MPISVFFESALPHFFIVLLLYIERERERGGGGGGYAVNGPLLRKNINLNLNH
jgi:hypothetical protein